MSWNVRIVSFAVTPSGEGTPSLLRDQPLRMKITMNHSRTRNVSLKKKSSNFHRGGLAGHWELGDNLMALGLGEMGGSRSMQGWTTNWPAHGNPQITLKMLRPCPWVFQRPEQWCAGREEVAPSPLVQLRAGPAHQTPSWKVKTDSGLKPWTLRVTFFSPWAEGGGSGGSSWPSHTFFKLPERSAVIVSGYNPRWSLVHSPTYGWGRPSQCTQGEWLAPAPISSHSKTLHLSPGRFHAALPSSQRSSQQRGPQLQSPQLSLLQEQTHLWLQGQHSGGP